MDILAFCRKRQISVEGFRITQSVDWSRSHTDQSKIVLHIELPPHFPVKYENVIGRAVDTCLVAHLGKGLISSRFEKSISRSAT